MFPSISLKIIMSKDIQIHENNSKRNSSPIISIAAHKQTMKQIANVDRAKRLFRIKQQQYVIANVNLRASSCISFQTNSILI